jgi:hypothetical protein
VRRSAADRRASTKPRNADSYGELAVHLRPRSEAAAARRAAATSRLAPAARKCSGVFRNRYTKCAGLHSDLPSRQPYALLFKLPPNLGSDSSSPRLTDLH